MKTEITRNIIKAALREDTGAGDITTSLIFPKPLKITAKIVAKESGVICGLQVVEAVFKTLDKNCSVIKKASDGEIAKKGQVVCVVRGDARKILTGERTALNFLSRLSGISTLTRQYVEKVQPYKVEILDTRKTTPALRVLEKYAVKCGGGFNHRMGLWDAVLIKDNHIKVYALQCKAHGKKISLATIIKEAREKTKKKIEIEVENLHQFRDALKAKPDIIMLDNMKISDIKVAVDFRNNLRSPTYDLRPKLEVSGGITLSNIRAIAKTGVDMISIGALTHSAKGFDFSLEVL